MTVLLFFIISYVLLSISLYFLFPKAGVEAVNGLIPGLNFIEWAKMIGRPDWWPILLLIPIVNFFIFIGMAINLVRSFGQYSFLDSTLAFIYAPASFFKIAFDESAKYGGPNYTKESEWMQEVRKARKEKDERKLQKLTNKSPYHKSALREWVESIVFAVFAAAFIRMFLIEAFVIPTPSMEGSLLVGDFLFVSKASYGIRTPMTVAMVPLLHNRVPFLGTESYLKKPNLKYHRLKAMESIDRNKPIVFNWPVGDSVYITSQRSYTVGQVERNKDFLKYDRELAKKVRRKDFVVRPVDKKDHYIKRCVATAGDTLQIIDRQVYINGEKATNPKHMQFLYAANYNPAQVNTRRFADFGVDAGDAVGPANKPYGFFLDGTQVEEMEALGVQLSIQKNNPEPRKLFPHDPKNFPSWSIDNYGPIWIPKKGTTIDIDLANIALYRRVIDVYEDNDLEIRNGDIFINGEKSSSYTFKQDYYWAMGDNRHNSEDSRAWGFVPHDHVVGKPLFIWMSTKEGSFLKGIRFERIFKSANVD